MRQIGSFQQRSEAARFAAFLVTQGISAHTEEDSGNWTLWVREEDALPRARSALSEFQDDPSNPKYEQAEQAAAVLQREEESKRVVTREQTVHMRERWRTSSSASRRPLTIAILLLCGGLGLASGLGSDNSNQVLRTLLFCDPLHAISGWQGDTVSEKLVDIRNGEWWRLLTPIFLHGSIMHLAFNMIMFYQIGAAIEQRRGTWRLGLMIVVIGIVSNLFQALVPNDWGGTSQFLGFSGVVYGLFGYIWMKSRYQPALGLYIDRSTVIVLMVFMILGFTGLFDSAGFHLANWAHGAGFVTGVLIGITPVLARRIV